MSLNLFIFVNIHLTLLSGAVARTPKPEAQSLSSDWLTF